MSRHHRQTTSYWEHPSIWMNIHSFTTRIGLTLSSSFSRASLRLALLIISLQRVWQWGISLSESEGRRYVSMWQNGPLSTSWKALIIISFNYSKSRMNWESLPCLQTTSSTR
jgi:hypothetical protein